MPKRYFQMVPTIDYDIDNSGTTQVVINILNRVKARAETLLDGAVFYNYQIQDGDNAEIIADKYYGSSQYHWVVLMMNDILDHTYGLPLSDGNFENYISSTYGSYSRASGATVNLASTDYMSAGLKSDPHTTVITSEAQQYNTANPPQKIQSSASGNTGLVSGFFPAGNTTAIWIYTSASSDPFKEVDVGDVVNLFVPEHWYDRTGRGDISGNVSQTSTDTFEVYLADDASDINNYYAGGTITITGEGDPINPTGITGNTRTISTYDSSTKKITIAHPPFETMPQGNLDLNLGLDTWAYTLSFDKSKHFPLIPYTSSAKILAKSVYRTGSVTADLETNPFGIWIPDTQEGNRYFQINIGLDSTNFENFSAWNKAYDIVYLQTGIHHFERDIYDASGTILLANNVSINQDQYVNTSIGISNSKKIVTNLEYESSANEDKRVIYLLKKDYLQEFVEEFNTVMGSGL